MYNLPGINQLGELLLTQNQTIAVAESVTAGNLQAAISLAENATKFFQGGLTVYNVGQKSRQLKVDPIHAISCNCVSGKIAEQMAIEVTQMFSSDWGIGITGYAAPVPEFNIRDLFAFVAFAYKGKIVYSEMLKAKNDDVDKVQEHYVNCLIEIFCKQFPAFKTLA